MSDQSNTVPENNGFSGPHRLILRTLQREGKVQRAALSVRVRPAYPNWTDALEDLIRRGFVVEAAEVLRREGGRVSSVVQYTLAPDVNNWPNFMEMKPEDIDEFIRNYGAIPSLDN